jgi:hypothetical protein
MERLTATDVACLTAGIFVIDFGVAALWLRTGDRLGAAGDLLGAVALAVGVVHLINAWVFTRVRRHRR